MDSPRRLGTLMARTVTLRSPDGEHRIDIADGRFIVDGVETTPPRRAHAVADGDDRWVFLDGEVYVFEITREGRKRTGAHHGTLTAPMPATVIRINTPAGTPVKRGETLLVLEAMKMELPIRATTDGTVKAVNCRVGDLVQAGVSLIELE